MKKFTAIVIFIISALAASAQSVHSMGDLAFSLFSIQNLSGGVHVTDMETPHNTMYNPASAAGFQRLTADINYINLQGLGTISGVGHVVNGAVSFPTKYGVLTGSIHWLGSNGLDGSLMDFGNIFMGNFTFSKEIYSDLYIGSGITLSAGGSSGSGSETDWGAGFNLGFIQIPGNLGFMKNFRWGVVLDHMGKGFGDKESGYDKAIPGNFTLGTGFQFDLIDKDNFMWTVAADLRAPTLTDLKVDLGTDILIANMIKIDSSISMSFRDAIAGEAGTLVPSVGLSVKIPLGNNEESDVLSTSEMNINIAAAPLYDDVWAFGGGVTLPFGVLDDVPPELEVELGEIQYISPNFDGVQDELIIPFTVNDDRYIDGYSLIIKSEEGYIVKEIYNKDERPENESIQNLFTRLVSAKEGTSVPEAFRWDGKADAGDMVSDGNYTFEILFWDDNRNFIDPFTGEFIIDTEAPSVSLEQIEGTDLIFSPDGDGNKDIIQFNQSGSQESEWKGVITDSSGNAVREFVWYGTLDNAVWDGTDNDGNLLPDGVYQYQVIAIDEAGNTVKKAVENSTVWDDLTVEEDLLSDDEYKLEVIEIEESVESVKNNIISNIIVNTKKPPVNVYIDKAWFSPDSENGEQDLLFTLDVPVKTGILEWRLDVVNTKGLVINTFSSKEDGWGPVPETITYDGKNKFNSVIGEESYKGKLVVKYQNGYNPEAESPLFNVDITPPESSISTAYRIFSPNGDKNKDEAEFTQSGSSEDEWLGVIKDAGGLQVKSYSWKNGLDRSVSWDGRTDKGDLAGDGEYTYYLTATDKAGNTSFSNIVTIQLDNSDTEAAISVNLDAFSPNRDGVKDQLEMHPIVKVGSTVKIYTIAVTNMQGAAVKSWTGSGQIPGAIKWDGKAENGTIAADGQYRSSIKVEFEKGDIRDAQSTPFILDTASPEITVNSPYTLFSPDGDNQKDVVSLNQNSGRENEFYGKIIDSAGVPVRSWFWSEQLSSIEWDGNDESGNRVQDGRYTYSVQSEDAAGNKTVKTIENITIDTSDTPVFLTVKNNAFAPSLSNGTNTQQFSIIVSNQTGIDNWSLKMVLSDGSVVKTFSGDSSDIPKNINWDGKGDNSFVTEGEYTGQFTIEYNKGNRPVIESTPFVLDDSAPDARLTLQPDPFSPDDDNVDDELNISITVDDLSPVKNWSMVINDPKGREFISFKGRGRPSERIIWDGRSMKGELVQSAEDYSYIFTVSDILGNERTVDGEIPVDVLVVRDGDRFKIQISSITFKADSAEYNDTGDLKEKNEKILGRIAEILKKYSSYKILIEGNAASTKYYDKKLADKEEIEELQPLSLQRAETVKNSLISLGVPRGRLDVEGKGGTNPVVPHSDLENAWKNRRVEFILLK